MLFVFCKKMKVPQKSTEAISYNFLSQFDETNHLFSGITENSEPKFNKFELQCFIIMRAIAHLLIVLGVDRETLHVC